MLAFFPPVLTSKGNAIPGVDSKQADGYYLDIEFPMPSRNLINNLKDIGHVQVSIKNQSTNEPAVNPEHSPDRQIIYIKNIADGIYFKRKSDLGNYIIRVPYRCFAGGAPERGVTYTIQVRFGADNALWDPSTNGIDGLGAVGAFANWRNTQVNAVPSGFGEWSNVMTVYCYGPASESLSYNLNDFVPEVCYSYAPENGLDDPLQQVKITYNYKDIYGDVFDTQVFNGAQQKDGAYTIATKIPIAPIAQINVSVEAVTKNNVIRGGTLTIMPLKFTQEIGVIGGTLEDAINIDENDPATHTPENLRLKQQEIEDGVIAKTFTVKQSPDFKKNSTYSVYRFELYSLKTIKIIDKKKVTMTDKYIFKDFTVEMGEEYQYVVTLNDSEKDACYALVVPIYDIGYENPGYGRLMKMDSVFLTTKKHQLRLSGNVQISAFKRNTQDSFQNTIGSKYPFYSRNSKMNYRTFSLSGLISIIFDPTATFLRNDEKNGLWWDNEDSSKLIILNKDIFNSYQVSPNRQRIIRKDNATKGRIDQFSEKQEYWPEQFIQVQNKDGEMKDYFVQRDTIGTQTVYDPYLHQDNLMFATTEKTDQMVFLERKFRECVMEWLSDGKPKLFRSETEGNMIVMLSGIQLTPFDKSSRMVYNVSMTVTEIAEASLDNLFLYNLVPIEIESRIISGFPRDLVFGDIISHQDYLVLTGVDHSIESAFQPVSGGEWQLADKEKVDEVNLVIHSITDYSFTRGDLDPWITKRLIYQYNKIYDIPDSISGLEIKKIDTRSAVKNYVKLDELKFSISNGNLPKGLTFDESTGIISGTPVNDTVSATEPYYVTLKVTDPNLPEGEREATMTIKVGYIYTELILDPFYDSEGGIVANPKSIPDGIVGEPIAEVDLLPNAHGGVKFSDLEELDTKVAYLWYAEGLPGGLSITENGKIVGSYLSPNQKGVATIIITDAVGQTKKQNILFGSATLPLTFKDSIDYDIYYTEVGTAIDKIDVSGGVSGGHPYDNSTSPYIHGYKFSAQGLPEGISIDEYTGIISGIPVKAQDPGTAIIRAEDSCATPCSAEIKIVYQTVLEKFEFIAEPPLTIDPYKDGSPMGIGLVLDPPIEVLDRVKGGLKYIDEPNYRFSSDDLIPDFKIDNYGKITGRASVEHEARTAYLIVRDAREKELKCPISIVAIQARVKFTPTSEYKLPPTYVGNSDPNYKIEIPFTDISQGTPPYKVSLLKNDDDIIIGFPKGVDLSVNEAEKKYIISGVPKEAQSSTWGTIVIEDSSNEKDKVYVKIPIGEVAEAMTWNPDHLDGLQTQVGTPYSVSIATVKGGMQPYTLKCLNPFDMEPGMQIRQRENGEQYADNIILYGTPTEEWPGEGKSLVFVLTDKLGQEQQYTMVIGKAQGAFELKLLNSLENIPFIAGKTKITDLPIMQASGGDEKFTYNYIDSLNTQIIENVTLNKTNGTISGIITKPTSSAQEVSKNMFALNKGRRIISQDKWYLPRVYADLAYYPGIGKKYTVEEHTVGETLKDVYLIQNYNLPGQKWSVNGTLPEGIVFTEGKLAGQFRSETDECSVKCRLDVPENRTTYIYTPALSIEVTVTFKGAHGGFAWTPSDLTIVGGEVGTIMPNRDISDGLMGGKSPLTWTIEPSAPSWLKIDYSQENGRKPFLHGLPDKEQKEPMDIVITVTDAVGTKISQIFRLQPIYAPLVFKADSRMNISAQQANVTIPNFDIIKEGLVTGGSGIFTFFADDNLFPYTVSENGIIGGNSGKVSQPARTATITVRDSITEITRTATLQVGAINGEMNYTHDPSRDIPAGKINTSGTINYKAGVIGGTTPEFSIYSYPETGWTEQNLKINSTSGVLTYTRPGQAQQSTSFIILIKDKNSTAEISQEVKIGEVTA